MQKLKTLLEADEKEYQARQAAVPPRPVKSFPASGGAAKDTGFPEPDEAGAGVSEVPDGGTNAVEITAFSIEDALNEAADRLSVPISSLDYEIIQQGQKGFLGFGRKPFIVQVMVMRAGADGLEHSFSDGLDLDIDAKVPHEEIIVDRDGEFKIRPNKEGVMLIVKPPVGSGKKVDLTKVKTRLFELNLKDVPDNVVEEAVSVQDGVPVKIGEWIPNEDNDAHLEIDVSSDEMRVTAILFPPKSLGRYLDYDDIVAALQAEGVSVGIKEDTIRNMVENEVFNQKIMVAEGERARDGADARIVYKFRTSDEIELTEDEKGQIDFHELNKVENVVVGQELAELVPETLGTPGRTVTNKLIEAKDGKEIEIRSFAGKNTEVSEDSVKIIATVNGQVILINNKVTVDPVFEVHGDVNLEVGNIVFLGKVIVTGNVEDGFSVKASGDIEIRGSVGRATLESEQNIRVNVGIMGRELGKGEAVLIASGDVYAKFVQNARIEAGRTVYVYESIINCMIDAEKDILLNGKRAQITGGRLRASEEINAKILGSPSYTETILEAGINPKSREELLQLESQLNEKKERMSALNKDITNLEIRKEEQKGLSEEKEAKLKELLKERMTLQKESKELETQAEEIKSYLSMVGEKGCIGAAKLAYPGVRVTVKNAILDIRDEFKYVKFVQDSGNIRSLPYEEARETTELKRKKEAGKAGKEKKGAKGKDSPQKAEGQKSAGRRR